MVPDATGTLLADYFLFFLSSACRDRHLYYALTASRSRSLCLHNERDRGSKHHKGACRDRHWQGRTKGNRAKSCLLHQALSEQDREGGQGNRHNSSASRLWKDCQSRQEQRTQKILLQSGQATACRDRHVPCSISFLSRQALL